MTEQQKLRRVLGDILAGEAKFYDGNICSSTCHFSRALVILVGLIDDVGDISDEYRERIEDAKKDMHLSGSLDRYS